MGLALAGAASSRSAFCTSRSLQIYIFITQVTPTWDCKRGRGTGHLLCLVDREAAAYSPPISAVFNQDSIRQKRKVRVGRRLFQAWARGCLTPGAARRRCSHELGRHHAGPAGSH
jgi:hypothetical protein